MNEWRHLPSQFLDVVLKIHEGVIVMRNLLPRKTWYYFCTHTEDIWISGAWVDLVYGGSFFFSVFDLKNKKVIADQTFLPIPVLQAQVFGLNCPIEELNDQKHSPFQALGLITSKRHSSLRASVKTSQVKATLEFSGLEGRIQIQGTEPKLEIDLAFALHPSPLRVVSSFQDQSKGFTQKDWGVLKESFIKVGNSKTAVDLTDGNFSMDYTRSQLPRHTIWKWALTLQPGLNLSQGNHLGDVCENALLIPEGGTSPLDPVKFDISEQNSQENLPWQIKGPNVDLKFTPVFCHRENRNWGILSAAFEQWVGHFDGTVTTAKGQTAFEQIWGVAEKQNCRW